MGLTGSEEIVSSCCIAVESETALVVVASRFDIIKYAMTPATANPKTNDIISGKLLFFLGGMLSGMIGREF